MQLIREVLCLLTSCAAWYLANLCTSVESAEVIDTNFKAIAVSDSVIIIL